MNRLSPYDPIFLLVGILLNGGGLLVLYYGLKTFRIGKESLSWPTVEGEITTTRLLKRRSVNMTHFLLAISLGMILLIIGMVFLLSQFGVEIQGDHDHVEQMLYNLNLFFERSEGRYPHQSLLICCF